MKKGIAAALLLISCLCLVAATTNPSQLWYTATGTGAVKRTQASKLSDTVSVKDFGAVGDGTTDDYAAFAAADAAVGTNGVIEVPSTSGGYKLGALFTLGKSHTLRVNGLTTITHKGINFADSATDFTGIGYIRCPDGATFFLANGANVDSISQTNYASLTGTTNTFGLSRAVIEGCIIDGNKANNASGYGVRIYGRGVKVRNVTVQNAAQDGFRFDGRDTVAFTNPPDDDQQDLMWLRSINSGGDGFHFMGTQGWTIFGSVSWGSGAWGIYTNVAMALVNTGTFLNSTGGIWVDSGGSIQAANLVGTNAVGQGLLLDTGAGASVISSGSFGSVIGIEIRSPNHVIQGTVQNCTTGVKINGGSAQLSLSMTNNTTWFDVTGGSGQTVALVSSQGVGGTLFSGTPNGVWFVQGGDAAHSYNQIGLVPLRQSGNGNAIVLPASVTDNMEYTGAHTIAYSTSMTPAGQSYGIATITATDGVAFTINAPVTLSMTGHRLTFHIKNTSGGALGAATWNATYKLGAAWTQPATGNGRLITFIYNGTNWIEADRSAADVSN